MIQLLENEELKSREHGEKIRDLEAKNKSSGIVADVKNQRSLNETLRANIQNTEAKTRVDIEALGQSLQVVENKNLEYMTLINKQETKEKQLQGETETLREEV